MNLSLVNISLFAILPHCVLTTFVIHTMLTKEKYTSFIKATAQSLGFDYCGIAKAEKLNEDALRLETWLNKGFQGTMIYMQNYFDLRIDPTKLVPGSKSVITLLLNYFPSQKQNADAPQVSKYAYGKDYHEVIKEKLKTFLLLIKENVGDVHGRGFADSAPVLEKSWAQKSGLGWIGKNGNLITKNDGSFFFIATLITDLELESDDPFIKDFCGTCTRCIDTCPTE
ncbi:MAG: tRNA epoxyqueuosine(34) reductase QueG, partial [Ginsengibacter sp.]